MTVNVDSCYRSKHNSKRKPPERAAFFIYYIYDMDYHQPWLVTSQ